MFEKWSNLKNVRKFRPKQFYEIDPCFFKKKESMFAISDVADLN